MENREFELNGIAFKEIDFDAHSDICLKYRADSFFTSFGNEDGFWEEDGKGGDRYLDWLRGKDPRVYGSFHAWKDGQIVGQMELGLLHGDPTYGYVNLFYLVPEWRGKGLSETLNEFSKIFLKTLGVNRAKLSVSPTNKRACNYYIKQGWIDRGPRDFEGRKGMAHDNLVHWMEIEF